MSEGLQSNIGRYEHDLSVLIKNGNQLIMAMQYDLIPELFVEGATKEYGDGANQYIKALPDFKQAYQGWYSESLVVIKLLLPDRLLDFIAYYERTKPRKEITSENYTVADYLQGLSVNRGVAKVVEPAAALPKFRQQLEILKSVKKRFASSLFDIRQLVQADIFDSEIDAASELNKKKFVRAAGALAGVVLERHLSQVCENHQIKSRKKNPGISDYNDALKKADIIETPQWRSIQYLGDLRNLCDHSKKEDPTKEQVEDLIAGVAKITKALY